MKGTSISQKEKKPEKLIERIIDLTTAEGDWVLDSFLGYGTTASVANKMGRRWIGIELGEHCHTHCLPRLKRSLTARIRAAYPELYTPLAPLKGNEPTLTPPKRGL